MIEKYDKDYDCHPLSLPKFSLCIIFRRVHIQCEAGEVVRLQLPDHKYKYKYKHNVKLQLPVFLCLLQVCHVFNLIKGKCFDNI